MAAIVGFFFRLLGLYAVPLGWKLLRGLGFTAFSYVGIKSVLDYAKDYAFSSLSGLPVQWLGMLGLLKIDVCLNIIFSAMVARAVLRGMSGSGTKTGFKMGS